MNRIKLAATLFFVAMSSVALAQDAVAPVLNSRAMNRIEHRLSITPQQREQARAILLQEQPQLRELRANLVAERKELSAISVNGAFDPVAAHVVAMKYADANANAAVERAKLRTELFALLTPEQKEKLQQLRVRIASVFGSDTPGFGDTL